ncbi:signal recognition particle subunit SRP21 KNAG_0A06320 [Huiozyma naganishii CBS 8797]|uniref:SRP9 domain-containing protein n=1 Tax=Huiozyma naganishii (strain ATCC MYA-139 / BCRC 22969 / CBS 8797 / KCTC 17520 / NBRC 10181 / NCYC 3082 / Yp74L-3) TaxID=1071383 RepID=J7RFG5_HUIN7|nr:hypothetical protein KNAG_0A06320 [Kazachstania naganishii CBS 8797]CCK68293.1 hypothetical protein KNAG_0A06320 [Kazachstania naganishii CBS 8797]
MSIKPIDTFITNGVRLFEVNPSQSAFSITYKPPVVKSDKGAEKKVSKKCTKVAFRFNNAHLATNYSFDTNKSKDVSRLLNSLGPRGVSIANGKTNPISKKQKQKQIVGLSRLIVNTDVKEYVAPVPKKGTAATASSNNAATESQARKKKNKKNKKKR